MGFVRAVRCLVVPDIRTPMRVIEAREYGRGGRV